MDRQERGRKPGGKAWGKGRAKSLGKRGEGFLRQYRGQNWVGWQEERWSLEAQLGVPGAGRSSPL